MNRTDRLPAPASAPLAVSPHPGAWPRSGSSLLPVLLLVLAALLPAAAAFGQ